LISFFLSFGNYLTATLCPVFKSWHSQTTAQPPLPSKSSLAYPLGHLRNGPYILISSSVSYWLHDFLRLNCDNSCWVSNRQVSSSSSDESPAVRFLRLSCEDLLGKFSRFATSFGAIFWLAFASYSCFCFWYSCCCFWYSWNKLFLSSELASFTVRMYSVKRLASLLVS